VAVRQEMPDIDEATSRWPVAGKRAAWRRPSLSLVVPVYNEEVRLAESGPALVAFVAAFGAGSELIIADDGSNDGTREVAAELATAPAGSHRVRTLALPHRGKGATVQAGLQAAGGAVSAFCDVDLATPLEDLERLVRLVSAGPVVAAASRDVVTTTIVRPESAEREFLGKVYNRLIQLTLLPGVRDTQCGAKAAMGSVWRTILAHTHEPGFAWDVEVLTVARRLGFAVWEVGVAWSHDDRSKVRPLRDGASMVRAVPRIWRSARQVDALRCFEDDTVEPRQSAMAGLAHSA
jgi:glycosyltransferase involved in cell wall biosynthesis